MSTNHLLDCLPRRVRNDLVRHGEVASLEVGAVLCEPGVPLEHAWFPLTAFVAAVPCVDERVLECRLIGAEGMLGATLAVDVGMVPFRAVVHGGGTMLRIRATDFAGALRRSGTLRRLLRRYLDMLAALQLESSRCNRQHKLIARMARWLLMAHDCARADRVRLPLDFLAEVLNVSRGDVALASASLRRQEAVSWARGSFRVLDRRTLETVACECYALGIARYQRALGSPSTRSITSLGTFDKPSFVIGAERPAVAPRPPGRPGQPTVAR